MAVEVTNTGPFAGDEVVQLYVTDVEASSPSPIRQLADFRRIHLQAGERSTIHLSIAPDQMMLVDDSGVRRVEPGAFALTVGGRQPHRGEKLARHGAVVGATFIVV